MLMPDNVYWYLSVYAEYICICEYVCMDPSFRLPSAIPSILFKTMAFYIKYYSLIKVLNLDTD